MIKRSFFLLFVLFLSAAIFSGCRAADNDSSNDQIYADLSAYSSDPDSCQVNYQWAVSGDILSICAYAESLLVPDTVYFVYNVSIATGQLVSQEDLLAQSGMTEAQYLGQVKQALSAKFLELFADVYNSNDVISQERFDFTVSEQNLRAAKPFFGENDQLYVVANVGSLIGGDTRTLIVSLTADDVSFDEPSSATTTSDPLADAKEYALYIFNSITTPNWNGYNFDTLIDIVFTDYDVQCVANRGSETQFLVTLSGNYYPNVVDLPEVTHYGTIEFLVDTVEGTATLVSDDGIMKAFDIYIALGTAWYLYP